VEATHTHTGHPKELFFKNNRDMFEKFNHKIIHVIVDDFPHTFPNIDYEKKEQWINEKFQRNCGTRGFSQIPEGVKDEDIVIVADLDEIPDPRVLCRVKSDIDIVSLEMHFYYYNLHTKIKNNWYHAKLVSIGWLKQFKRTLDNIRFINCGYIPNSGWHLSYFGDVRFIQNKLQNFAHQEFNKIEITDTDVIMNKINTHTNLFDDTILEYCPIKSNPYLPLDYDKYLSKFIYIKTYF
jgi:beta-1,4-mannosyl-glycoprotein beta-1,4-N-acetylglucosaminyltransferase